MNNQSYNLAFVFPGQGSQSLGMLAELATHHHQVKETFELASDTLGINLWSILINSPEELDKTQNTQPIMMAAGVAVWEIWCNLSKVRPAWMAGHSLGEYTALVCAGSISFEDAIKLVATRGRLMQEAVPPGVGAMAAILGLEDHEVVNICAEAAEGEIVSAVNFNTLGQVVIAGQNVAVERAMTAAKKAGAKRVLPLPVSVPSHCALMKPAAEKFAEYLQNTTISTPNFSLIHNTDVASHTSPQVIRNVLKEQLYQPVRWVDTIKFMNGQGVSCFVECGPGKVLVGLNKRIAKDAEHLTIYDSKSLNDVLEQLT